MCGINVRLVSMNSNKAMTLDRESDSDSGGVAMRTRLVSSQSRREIDPFDCLIPMGLQFEVSK